MADLATLLAHRTALETARASGEKRVTNAGKTVEYRDISELERAIAAVDREIHSLVSASKPSSTFSVFRRGT